MTSPGTTTDDRLAEIQQRADAATAGPWSAADEHGLMDGAEPAWCVSAMDGEKYLYDVAYADGPNEAADAEFMAQARQDIPWLLAELVSLRGQLEAATKPSDEAVEAMAREYRNQLSAAIGNNFSAERTWAAHPNERVLDILRVRDILTAGGAR